MSISPSRLGKHTLYHSLAFGEKLLRPGLGTTPRALRSICNFLLLQYPSALGTAIHATPFVAALRAAIPQAHIAVAASGFGAEVFRNNPAIDLLLETPSPLNNLRGALRFVRERNIFSCEPYATLLTVGNERTPITLLAMFAGPSLRAGYSVAPQLFHIPLSFEYSVSQIEMNLRILRALGHAAPYVEPQLFPGATDEARATKLLAEADLLDGAPIAVLVTQTSTGQRKGWRPERFAEVARHLRQSYNAHILFVGTAGEAVAIDAIRSQLDFVSTSVAGKTSISVLAAVLRRCAIGITLDTGTLHIGRAVGLPMVIIAPAWSPVIEWLPVGNPRYRILKNADIPKQPPDYIIDEVSVGQVNYAADELMKQYPQATSTATVR